MVLAPFRVLPLAAGFFLSLPFCLFSLPYVGNYVGTGTNLTGCPIRGRFSL